MFTIKIKNYGDWAYYEAVDFVIIIPPEQPRIDDDAMVWTDPVSYTHLTLPTILLV